MRERHRAGRACRKNGATIDVRGQEIYPLLRRVIVPTQRQDVAPLLRTLDARRRLLVETLRDAAVDVRTRYGVASVDDAKLPAKCPAGQKPQGCDQIEFTTAGAVATPPIPWQDRPTFQQIVAVEGRRRAGA